jgi:EAL domain-containing protein (putative c-di-GMP-specific phosphodiesterase class I)
VGVTVGHKYEEEQVQWYLEAVADPNRKWMTAIKPFPFVIGRDENCNLNLTDNRVSRHHCEIRKSGDHFWIRDLESTNGTFVNHKEIKQAELLEPGDIISIGNFEFCLKSVNLKTAHTDDETCCFDLSQELHYLDTLEPKLRALIQARNVVPHFQPILRFSDKKVLGYEILGRHADEDLPSEPSVLLDMAEALGYRSDLSSVFREVGVEIGRKLPGSPIFFVNTTPLEIYQMNDLLESLDRIHDMAPSNRIVLEINEKAADDKNVLSRLRNDLGKHHTGIAFDDFGVGQTRLVELVKDPPDFLKFDISLIRQIHLAPKRLHQMVSTFVKAAQELDIATIAEGIECPAEAETCQQLGFNFAQGFFYGRPLPINEINISCL